MGKGRWQENQGRNELLWDHFGKDKKKESCFGGCREDRRGGAFSGEEVFVWLFWAERMQLDWE